MRISDWSSDVCSSDLSSAIASFRAAYDARSAIMHGRSELDDEGTRLRALALWSDITRNIWGAVIAEPPALPALHGSDSMRKDFLAGRCSARPRIRAIKLPSFLTILGPRPREVRVGKGLVNWG